VTEGVDRDRGDRRPRSRVIVGVAGAVLGLAAAALVIRELVVEWGPASDAIAGAAVGWLALAAVLAVAGMVVMASVWADVLTALNAPQPRGRVVRWYFLGELGKYLPGGVWTVLGRGELARRGGVAPAAAYGSVGLSLVMLYLAAGLTAAALVPFDVVGQRDDPRLVLGLAAVVVGGIALVHPLTLGTLLTLARRVTGRALVVDPPAGRAAALLVVRYLPALLLVGAATWAVARALDPDASLARVMLAAIASWIAGFLAVPVPAGGGVREAVFLAAAGLPAGVGAATAIAARLLFVAVDALGALVASVTARRRVLAAPPAAD
jgi:glycosyltransferase 2 family protein